MSTGWSTKYRPYQEETAAGLPEKGQAIVPLDEEFVAVVEGGDPGGQAEAPEVAGVGTVGQKTETQGGCPGEFISRGALEKNLGSRGDGDGDARLVENLGEIDPLEFGLEPELLEEEAVQAEMHHRQAVVAGAAADVCPRPEPGRDPRGAEQDAADDLVEVEDIGVPGRGQVAAEGVTATVTAQRSAAAIFVFISLSFGVGEYREAVAPAS